MFIDLLNNKKVGLKTWCTKKKFLLWRHTLGVQFNFFFVQTKLFYMRDGKKITKEKLQTLNLKAIGESNIFFLQKLTLAFI